MSSFCKAKETCYSVKRDLLRPPSLVLCLYVDFLQKRPTVSKETYYDLPNSDIQTHKPLPKTNIKITKK